MRKENLQFHLYLKNRRDTHTEKINSAATEDTLDPSSLSEADYEQCNQEPADWI